VLVVDNDDTYVRSVQRVLHNHDVTCCTTAGDALTEIGRGTTFDLILADVELSGTELYQALLVDHPGIARRLVFLAPPTAPQPINEFLATTPNQWFAKPIASTELRALVQSFAPRV
jgi:CheY-like chemotaxis protein